MKIYLAGPLFTFAERQFNGALAYALTARGHTMFLPQEVEQVGVSATQIFKASIGGINWADIVVANMDGADPDSGTCWEVGYAYKKKPIVLIRTDSRHEREPFGPYNLMLHQSANAVLNYDQCSIED